MSSGVRVAHTDGANELGTELSGTVCGKLQVGPGDNPLIRRITLSTANGGLTVAAGCNGKEDIGKASSVNGDCVVGLNLWGADDANGLTTRSVRTTLNVRATEPNIEVRIDGGGRRIAPTIEIQMGGVWRTKKETQ